MPAGSRPGQHAIPSESKPKPGTRPRGRLAPEISPPSSSRTTTEGTAINASPVAASMMAGSVSKRVIALRIVLSPGDCILSRSYFKAPVCKVNGNCAPDACVAHLPRGKVIGGSGKIADMVWIGAAFSFVISFGP